ncbi:DUF5339 family protein [Variovorax dokdonensis]|uniref:DUF5339 family protein n=1 Tax=Variovorax dokdonensis TaxID=344883 RepID=A0ABT7N5V0_9BURK|nr:DUF5339 family protein [Variovorax dokdonensis]MDM0043318.1 DUF5339 family protein [Variovorax dokdonensis]
MNKLFAVLPLVAALAACNGGDSTPPAAAPAPAAEAPATAPAPAAATAAAAQNTTPAAAPAATAQTEVDLPQECQDYLAKVSACVSKQSGPAADAMKTAMEQAKSSWAAMGAKEQIGAACKAASDAFAAQASAMQC